MEVIIGLAPRLGKLNESIHINCTEQCLVHSNIQILLSCCLLNIHLIQYLSTFQVPACCVKP